MVDKKWVLKLLNQYCLEKHGERFEHWAVNQDRLTIIEFMMDWYLSTKNNEIKYLVNHDKSMDMTQDQIEELRKAVEYSEKKYGLNKNNNHE
jgi:hypothetical protein